MVAMDPTVCAEAKRALSLSDHIPCGARRDLRCLFTLMLGGLFTHYMQTSNSNFAMAVTKKLHVVAFLL